MNASSKCGLTQSYLKELMSYDPETGLFTRLKDVAYNVKAGRIAGNVGPNGYRVIAINKKTYGAHRLAWLYMTGEWPMKPIDHINCVRDDNRWINLRQATYAQNKQNTRKAQINNKTGLLGVSPSGKRFRSSIFIDGKTIHIGTYASPIEAHQAYLITKRQIHPYATI